MLVSDGPYERKNGETGDGLRWGSIEGGDVDRKKGDESRRPRRAGRDERLLDQALYERKDSIREARRGKKHSTMTESPSSIFECKSALHGMGTFPTSIPVEKGGVRIATWGQPDWH